MSSKKISADQNQAQHISASLSQANILIIGSIAIEQCLARNLYQAGARKILFLDINGTDTNSQSEFFQHIKADWTVSNIEKFVQQADIVIDALSDWQKKVALSDICMESEKVFVHSGTTGFRFQIYTMIPGRSACLRCALPMAGIDEVPIKPANESTINAVVELVAAWQSLEAIKYLARIGIIQGNELFKFDCLSGEFEVIRGLDANLDCPDCGRKIIRRHR